MPTMHLTTAVFDPGTSLEGKGVPGTTPPSADPVTAGAKASQTADKTILDTTTSPPTEYGFIFWIIDAELYFTESATFTVPAHDFWATAWYQPIGGIGTPTPVFTTYAFTTDYGGRLLPNTPIKMVTPSSAWASPATTVATDTSSNPVVITAVSSLGGSNGFLNWWVNQGNASAGGNILTVPAWDGKADGYGSAVAFYGVNPCQSIIDQIANLHCEDINEPEQQKACETERHALELELQLCEKQHSPPVG